MSYCHKCDIERVRLESEPDELISDLADLYKIFGDSTRLRILSALMVSELCVQDLADLLQMNKSAISHQLRALKDNKLARSRREGKNVYYSLADEHVHLIIRTGYEHLMEDRHEKRVSH